jgi:hypothetical protein
MKRMFAVALAALALSVPAMSGRARAGDFSDWAAVVVAGDSRAHSGAPSAVFDNGRAQIARELVGMGFREDNIRQLSVRPQRYPDGHPAQTSVANLESALRDAAALAHGGCLAYLTSHGGPQGIAFGEELLSPDTLSRIVNQSCQGRPTVVVVSACFSGVFVPVLAAPDRIVLTAAARDRSSFGCGETDRYTYFDTCAVQALPGAGDIAEFGRRAIACVSAREAREHVDRPSNPQLSVGSGTAAVLPHWTPGPTPPEPAPVLREIEGRPRFEKHVPTQ